MEVTEKICCNRKTQEDNKIAYIYVFRNMLNALFGDDEDFKIYEINQPLPDGTIDKRDDGRTLNIVCSDVNKLVILKDKLGDFIGSGNMKLYFDYYYGDTDNSANNNLVNVKDRPVLSNGLDSTNLDIALLFEGNPHFSRFYSTYGQMGPVWCVVFKPELIQYFNDDGDSLSGRRSCAMEDIAREVFPEMGHYKIYFSTENIISFYDLKKFMTGKFGVKYN